MRGAGLMKQVLNLKCLVCSCFCFMLLIGFCCFNAYFNDIDFKSDYINLYGLAQNILYKKQIENFTIYNSTYDKTLVTPREELFDKIITAKVQEIKVIWDYLESCRILYIYVELPLPIVDEDDLPYGVCGYSHVNADILHEKQSDIPTIKLMDYISIPKENIFFYGTDHHWSGDTIFESYQIVLDQMIDQELVNKGCSINVGAFNRISTDFFLGSYGVKVGKYHVGEDQYVYYKPDFDTDFTFTVMTIAGNVIAEYSGSWFEALMDSSILNGPDYKNKYNAALRGNSGENQIINHDVANGKLLIISHS